MLPLVPTLAFAFVSFASSAFVILRIVIPILPPHPLSSRVPPVRPALFVRERVYVNESRSPNLGFLTSGLFLLQIRATSGSLHVTYLLSQFSCGKLSTNTSADPAVSMSSTTPDQRCDCGSLPRSDSHVCSLSPPSHSCTFVWASPSRLARSTGCFGARPFSWLPRRPALLEFWPVRE